MSRHAGMVCAGALLCAAAGCSFEAFLMSLPGPVGKSRSLPGPVDRVAVNLKTVLGNLNVNATEIRQGRDVRLEGVTRAGAKFALRLHQQYSTGGPHTLMTVEWDDEPDMEFWQMLMEQAVPQRRDSNGPAPDAASQPEKPTQAGN
jgi:hypothetical protein